MRMEVNLQKKVAIETGKSKLFRSVEVICMERFGI